MRKKQNINLAGKRDLDRQVNEMKDLENHIKNQVRFGDSIYDKQLDLAGPDELL